MEIDKKIIKKLIQALEDLKKSLNDKDVVETDNSIEEEVDPYCDCSLSPNRLRFGPLIIIILLFIQHLYTMKKINKIKIKINGKIKYIIQDYKLSELLKYLKIPLNKVAIELNEQIINKQKINKIKLKKNDKVEIVHFIGGG